MNHNEIPSSSAAADSSGDHLIVWALDTKPEQVSINGWVLDSACAITKGLDKPISRDCALKCAKAGSPLVILADDGNIYWPISDKTPSSGQNERLLPFAGGRVTATGKAYVRGGSPRHRAGKSSSRGWRQVGAGPGCGDI